MTALLYGMHDREGRHIVPAGGWVVDTVALSDNPAPTDYAALRADINWIVRLNWGYGSTGTIPLPKDDNLFLDRLAHYVHNGGAGLRWIIGNEPNHEQERPGGVYIAPARYADFFVRARTHIKTIDPSAQIIPAPCAPYHANPVDWLAYWREMLALIAQAGGCDGIAIHAYTRSSDPRDISRTDMQMGPPLEGQYSGFRTYQDALLSVPSSLRHLPAYITEFNELLPNGWDDRNTGVVQAAYREVDGWNQDPDSQSIQCLVLYRWPRYDQWHIEGKQGVIDDFRAAVALNFESPKAAPLAPQNHAQKYSEQQFIPTLSTGGNNPPPKPQPEIDARFLQRTNNAVVRATPQAGATYYQLVEAGYYPPPEGARTFGPDHHILVEVLNVDGTRAMGETVTFVPGNDPLVHKKVDKQSGPYGVDYDLYAAGHGYSVYVGGRPMYSDHVGGMGLGTIEEPHVGHHVTYFLKFQKRVATAPAAEPPTPPLVTAAYVIAPAGANVRAHPSTDAAIRAAIPYGEMIHVLGVGDEWSLVQAGDVEGWMFNDLIASSAPEPPPTQPTQPTPQTAGNDWPRIYAFIKRWEGGFVNNPNDPGGPTNKGVTLATYTRWRQARGQAQPTVEDLRNIADAEVEQIFHEWYYLASGADKLPWPVNLAQTDTAVNAGVSRAQEMLAKSGGNFVAYMGHLIHWYATIPNFEHFGRAWIRRRAEILLEASK